MVSLLLPCARRGCNDFWAHAMGLFVCVRLEKAQTILMSEAFPPQPWMRSRAAARLRVWRSGKVQCNNPREWCTCLDAMFCLPAWLPPWLVVPALFPHIYPYTPVWQKEGR
ncbi:hypothetical protein LZ31DRAFT_112409 [Colletotrichum somersetense]|nr:hypothetical protein LZ31DRAFT_112409 [Colletotrichum somersetense]